MHLHGVILIFNVVIQLNLDPLYNAGTRPRLVDYDFNCFFVRVNFFKIAEIKSKCFNWVT
jgi:hypothetical protein